MSYSIRLTEEELEEIALKTVNSRITRHLKKGPLICPYCDEEMKDKVAVVFPRASLTEDSATYILSAEWDDQSGRYLPSGKRISKNDIPLDMLIVCTNCNNFVSFKKADFIG